MNDLYSIGVWDYDEQQYLAYVENIPLSGLLAAMRKLKADHYYDKPRDSPAILVVRTDNPAIGRIKTLTRN